MAQSATFLANDTEQQWQLFILGIRAFVRPRLQPQDQLRPELHVR